MIPEDHRELIVRNSILFLQTITSAYGSEKGMEIWSEIADKVDASLKGEIFKALLTGELSGFIRIRGLTGAFNRVILIRTVRNYDKRRLALKEAIALVDQVINGYSINIEIEKLSERHMIAEKLSEVGFLM